VDTCIFSMWLLATEGVGNSRRSYEDSDLFAMVADRLGTLHDENDRLRKENESLGSEVSDLERRRTLLEDQLDQRPRLPLTRDRQVAGRTLLALRRTCRHVSSEV
jgi:hypothetical protein